MSRNWPLVVEVARQLAEQDRQAGLRGRLGEDDMSLPDARRRLLPL